MGIGSNPLKTQPELIVDANAVLALAVALQRFEMIGRRNAKVLKTRCRVQPCQLPARYRPQVCRNPAALARLPESLQIGILEALDHEPILTHNVHNDKRYFALCLLRESFASMLRSKVESENT